MGTKIIKILLLEYKIDKKPDYIKLGNKVDKIIENSGVQVKCLNTNKVTSGNDLTINWAFILKNTLLYDIYHVYPYAKDSANPGIFRDGGNISFVASASPTNKIPSLLPLSPILGESFPNQEELVRIFYELGFNEVKNYKENREINLNCGVNRWLGLIKLSSET